MPKRVSRRVGNVFFVAHHDSIAGHCPRGQTIEPFAHPTRLADNEATCALQFNNRDFRFRDVGQIRRSLDRLSRDNLHEDEMNLSGRFLGVLPTKRTFEFKLQENDEIISGKVGAAISTPAELNAHLGELANIKVMITRVGSGKPRYLLLEIPEWPTEN